MIKRSLLVIFLWPLLLVQAQTINFNGKIVEGSKPLYGVTVLLESKSVGTVTDMEGIFKMPAMPGDKIKFSSIGYKTVYYTIPDTINDINFRVLVSMVQDTLLLKEAIVMPWPVNRTMLKEAMLNQSTEKEKIAPYAGFREIEGDPVEPEPTLMNPISFIFTRLSKKYRQEKKMDKYREILQEDEFYDKEKDDKNNPVKY